MISTFTGLGVIMLFNEIYVFVIFLACLMSSIVGMMLITHHVLIYCVKDEKLKKKIK